MIVKDFDTWNLTAYGAECEWGAGLHAARTKTMMEN
jgi:hypothetical protein